MSERKADSGTVFMVVVVAGLAMAAAADLAGLAMDRVVDVGVGGPVAVDEALAGVVLVACIATAGVGFASWWRWLWRRIARR